MKKVYLFASLLLVSSSVISQTNYQQYEFAGKKTNKMLNASVTESRPTNSFGDDRAVLWSEDFTTTTNDTTTVNGIWERTGQNSEYWEIASTGFTTAVLDGEFLYWNSYTPLNGNEAGAFSTTPVYGSMISPSIDLSSTSAILLEFDLRTMACCNATDIPWEYSISLDGGVTFGSTIKIDMELGNNESSNDISVPYKYSKIVNLDATPANNSDVKIRFTWNGIDPSGAGQSSTFYFWSIDNVNISDIPAFDIQHNKLWLADTRNAYEYTNFPANQFGFNGSTNLTVQSKISNFGLSTPTNMALEVTLYNSTDLVTPISGPVSGGTLLNNTIASAEIDTITFETSIDLSILTIGEYKVRTVISYTELDEVQSNDTLWRTFKISDTEYGHVNYDLATTTSDVPSGDEGHLGAYFDINSDVSLYGVDFYIVDSDGTVNTTTLDQPLYIRIYEVDASNNLTPVASYDYTLTSAMIDNWYTFDFPSSEKFDLIAGGRYIVTLVTEAGNYLNYNSSPEDTDFSGVLVYGGTNFWSGDEPWMRLNFDQTLDVNNNELNNLSVSQNVPNPFTGETVVSYSLNETSNVSLQIMDVTGKVVSTINEGNQAAGSHNVSVDGSALAVGTYFYTLTAGTYQVTKRMVVSK